MSADDCIFCAIEAGEMPSRTVHETDEVIAFLDVNPLAEGHTLVVPRAHYARLGAVPAETSDAVFGVVHELVPTIETAVDADAVTVGVNDGAAAGQEVPHVHVHVVPRFEGDGGGPIHAVAGRRPDLSDAELDEVADRIRTAAADAESDDESE